MKTIEVEITHRDPDILNQKVADYYRGYHPMGYDNERKVWVCKLTRLESCD